MVRGESANLSIELLTYSAATVQLEQRDNPVTIFGSSEPLTIKITTAHIWNKRAERAHQSECRNKSRIGRFCWRRGAKLCIPTSRSEKHAK